MMNRPKVKICGITRWEDAKLALELGADALGINVYPKSPRSLRDKERLRELLNQIPAGKRVMVDVNTGTDELEDWADLGFDTFQIHCEYELPLVSVAAWSGIVGRERLWLAPKVPPGEPFPQAALEFVDTILADAYSPQLHGGTGKTGDWDRFGQWQTLYPHKTWVLAGGLTPENIRRAVIETEAQFVDLASGVEAEPGIKDPKRVRALFDELSRL